MRLRNVLPGDVEAYLRMRCDPVMMAELGGPLPRAGIKATVLRDAAEAAADTSWIKMIVPDHAALDVVAGLVTLWSHEEDREVISEIGWMVLPEFQGRGIERAAVRRLLGQARDQRRWGQVHAFPGITNGPSNGICRSIGFRLLGQREIVFIGRLLPVNHWVIDPATELRRRR